MLGFGQGGERRQALVIGNTAYAKDGELPAAVNDAKAVEQVLTRLGFQVRLGLDCDYAKTQQLFDDFNADLKKETAKIGLLYYSGHGLQVGGKSYLMPIGSEIVGEQDFAKLVNIEDQIEEMSKLVTARIILLDACRSNPFAESIDETTLKSRGINMTVPKLPDSEKGYGVGGKPIRPNGGLAEIGAETGTFISFAAAPGGVAYESPGETHSKYTAALLRDIEATDLPLGNLMIRVRNSVSRTTERKQKTWDHSSLEAPFFFSPGSLLMLVGNMIGLIASVLSVLPFAFSIHAAAASAAAQGVLQASTRFPSVVAGTLAVTADKYPPLAWYWTALGVAVALTSFVLFLIGLQRAYRLLRGENELGETGPDGQGSHQFPLLLRRGLFGGFFGGVIAAPLITTAYYYSVVARTTDLPAFGQLLTETTIACVIIGLLLGVLTLSTAEWFEKLRVRWPQRGRFINPFTGAVVGGIIAGVIIGPWVTLYFGWQNRPFVLPHILLIGAIPGTAILIFSILNYTLERINLAALGRSLLASLGAVVVVGVIAGGLGLLFQQLIQKLADGVPQDPIAILIAGLPYGVAVGIALGSVFGLAYIWSTPKPATV